MQQAETVHSHSTPSAGTPAPRKIDAHLEHEINAHSATEAIYSVGYRRRAADGTDRLELVVSTKLVNFPLDLCNEFVRLVQENLAKQVGDGKVESIRNKG